MCQESSVKSQESRIGATLKRCTSLEGGGSAANGGGGGARRWCNPKNPLSLGGIRERPGRSFASGCFRRRRCLRRIREGSGGGRRRGCPRRSSEGGGSAANGGGARCNPKNLLSIGGIRERPVRPHGPQNDCQRIHVFPAAASTARTSSKKFTQETTIDFL